MSGESLPQRALLDTEFRAIAERNETFLHILPTLTRAELSALIAKNPRVWAPYARFLSVLK